MDRDDARDMVRELFRSGNDKAARHMMHRHCVGDEAFIDSIITEQYLERAKGDWLSGWDRVTTAMTLLPLGPSMPVREKIVAALIKCGFYKHAQQVATVHLHRQLTVDEIRALVIAYTTGAAHARSTDEDLKALAYAVGGRQLRTWAEQKIEKFHQDSMFD